MPKGSAFPDILRLRPRNIRNRLLRDLGLIVALISGAILVVTLVVARGDHLRVAKTHIEQTASFAAREFQRRFEPVDRGLVMAKQWGKMGMVGATDPARLVAELTPVLRPLEKVTSAVVADDEGRAIRLWARRAPDGALEGWLTRTRSDAEQNRVLQQSWDPDGNPLGQSWVAKPAYDPTEQPWFIGAAEAKSDAEIVRSAPHELYPVQAFGVSESMRWTNAAGATHVVAFDMLLTGIFDMVREIAVSQNGVAFLCNSAGEVFSPRLSDADVDAPPVFVAPEEVNSPLVANAVRAWIATDGSDAPVRFKAAGEEGWAGFRALDASAGLWIGVAVPDPDIFGAPLEGRAQLALGLGLILVAGMLLATQLVRAYAHQLRDLPQRPIGERSFAADVRALVERGEGQTVEFKSTVRRNLKTHKNGKEIELAWLKAVVAFLNTDGGTVLIGVGDGGEILGTDPDAFESTDRCRLHLKNLVNQHIGAEFSSFIDFQVQSIEAKRIVAVQCERSPNPVFLSSNNKEAFYIRSGPSSIELSPRQVLEYVRQRA